MNVSQPHAGGQRYDSLWAQIGQASAQWEQPDPPFVFEIGWAAQYEKLFQDEYEEKSPVINVLDKARSSGRVLLAAKGGSAKTTIVKELFRNVLNGGSGLPIFVPMRQWRAPLYEQWNQLPEGWVSRLNFILQELSSPQISVAALDVIASEAGITLFIDGLNEVSSAVAQDLLVVLDEFVSRTAQARVIVTDRLTRRMLPSAASWRLATVLPIDTQQVRDYLVRFLGSEDAWAQSSEADRSLLRIPFFLNQRLHAGGAPTSRAAMFEQYFAQHAVGEARLDPASEAAFRTYREDGSRTFPLSEFRELAGQEITETLLQAGTLESAGNAAYFKHHLHHDYLASRYLAHHRDQWNPTTFDRITYRASSFDILSLTLEQLGSTSDIDDFLTLTYDWNLYGAAYALAETYSSSVPVSREMETVIIAMLADRKWDLMSATVQHARDALALFPVGSLGRQMLSVDSRAELVRHVAEVDFAQSWFGEWRSLFTTPERSRVGNETVAKVLDEHSIIGWTTANVLRRLALDDEQLALLRSWVSGPAGSPAVVWRIAHVLGTQPNEENRELLLGLLSSPLFWVRYGAIRSLVECAALGNSRLRRSTFEQLRRRLHDLPARLVMEFEEAVLIDPARAPRDWVDVVIPVIRELYAKASSDKDRVRIEHTIQELMMSYSARPR